MIAYYIIHYKKYKNVNLLIYKLKKTKKINKIKI
jgi:hypothetical protein